MGIADLIAITILAHMERIGPDGLGPGNDLGPQHGAL